jgi:hypothetical protein
MDAVFGPALVVNQGMGMSEETRRALSSRASLEHPSRKLKPTLLDRLGET